MHAMVLQLEPGRQSSFKEYGPWHFRDQRYAEDRRVEFGDSILHVGSTATLVKPDADFVNANLESESIPEGRVLTENEEHLQSAPPTASTDSNPPGYTLPSALAQSASSLLCLSSRTPDSASASSVSPRESYVQPGYDFPSAAHQYKPRLSLKRCRADSDVDGPDTASQGRKKRRLRRDLVTSPLSRPFSEPATHIINRESATSSNKQFLKLAAILSARRKGSAASTPAHRINHPSPSSLLRRAAVLNRFRLNVKERAAEQHEGDVVMSAINAALLQQNLCMGLVRAGFPVAPSSGSVAIGLGLSSHGSAQRSNPPCQPSRAAAEAEARPRPTSPRLKAVEAARLNLPPSPKASLVRPSLLGSAWICDSDDLLDDEGLADLEVAFPSSEHESRYESTDEPDEVYADFGVLFGGGSADVEPNDDERDNYEDYMDDLDGIPWTAR